MAVNYAKLLIQKGLLDPMESTLLFSAGMHFGFNVYKSAFETLE